MAKKEFLDEKIIELLDQVEHYAGVAPESEQQEGIGTTEQSLESSFVIKGTKVEFERKIMIDDKLTIMLPTDFTEMDTEFAKLKYPSEGRPQIIFTDPSGGVNFWVTLTQEPLLEKGIEDTLGQMFGLIRRLNPGIKPQQSGVEQVASKTVAYIEYSNPAIEGKVYNLMFLFSINEKMAIACFNCSTKEAKYWRRPMLEMLKSMEFTIDGKESN